MKEKHNYYLIIDLEATCSARSGPTALGNRSSGELSGAIVKPQEMEIIEIGAVIVETSFLQLIDEFQTFIKPVINPILTDFCQQLTSISQADVDNAPTYPEAISIFTNWLDKYPNYIFGSWGNYDKNQFIQDSKYHQLAYPLNSEHINLKQLFSLNQGLEKKFGMAKALELAAIKLEGIHHRGIDDARNIAKLMPYILGFKKLNSTI